MTRAGKPIRASQTGSSWVCLPILLSILCATQVTALPFTLGADHACIIQSPAGITCFGGNSMGQLGQDDTTDSGLLASQAKLDFFTTDEPKEVVAGDGFTCATFGSEFRVRCWGDNSYGQLGQGDTTARGIAANQVSVIPFVQFPVATTDPAYEQVRNLAAGDQHACAIFTQTRDTTLGNVRCWGNGDNGRLGQRPETGSNIGDDTGAGFLNEMLTLPYLQFSTSHSATMVSLGEAHSCALFSTGGVRCWGSGSHGQTGFGSAVDIGNAVLATDPSPRRRRRVLRELPALWTGTRLVDIPFIDFGTTDIVIDVNAGGNVTCVIFSNDKLRCFGQGTYGQLGTGSAANVGDGANQVSVLPTIVFQDDVDENGKVVAVSVGQKHACAIFKGSRVRCWGDNSYGQLGRDDSVPSIGLAPNEMSLIPYIVFKDAQQALEIQSGHDHTCAVFQRSLTDQSMRCWGRGNSSRLGLQYDPAVGHVGDEVNEVKLTEYLLFDPNINGVYGQVFPHGGHQDGGFKISLHMPRWYTSKTLAIKVQDGDTGVTAQALSVKENARVLSFDAPIWGMGGRKSAVVRILITSDGLNYVDVGTSFIYYIAPLMVPFPQGGPIAGGMNVIFNNTEELVGINEPYLCRFGNTPLKNVVAGKIDVVGSNTRLVCDPSPAVVTKTSTLEISLNGGVSFLSYPWIYYQSSYTGLSPNEGPVRGATNMEIQGTDMPDVGDEIQVFFTDGLSSFTVTGAATAGGIVAVTPDLEDKSSTFLLPHQLSVRLSLNAGQHWEDIPYKFTLLGPTFVRSVNPVFAPRHGGFVVTVKGFNFANAPNHYVRFTNETGYHHDVPASLNALSEIVVTTPAIPLGGPGQIEISFNQQQWTNDRTSFSIFEVHSIYPTGGPLLGGTAIDVFGNGFQGTDGLLKCRFGPSAVVQAIFVTKSHVKCTSPFYPNPDTLFVEVSLDNNQYTNDKTGFTYYTEPSFTALDPDRGPISTVVPFQIQAVGFTMLPGNPPVGCRVGEKSTLGSIKVVNGTFIVQCVAPAASGSGEVMVAVNEIDFVATGLSFTYFSPYAVSPTSGPSSGNTEIQITGTGFADSDNALCAFGDTKVPANVLSAQTVLCVSPQMGASTYNLEYSHDGITFSSAQNKFTFFATPQITLISPLSVPSVGAPITLTGLNLNGALGDTRCKFGQQIVSAIDSQPGRVVCQAPTRSVTEEVVEVSFNSGSHFTNNRLNLQYFRVSVMKPGNGPTAEATDVTMTGTGFLQSNEGLMLCKMENKVGDDLLIQGRRLDDNRVVCTVPPRADAISTRLLLSTNNGTYYDETLTQQFSYYQSPEVNAMTPQAGPAWFQSGNGTVWITIIGENFFDSSDLGCYFGGAASAKVEYISETRYRCAMPYGNGKPPVYATFSGQDRLKAGEFAYYTISSVTPNTGPITGGTEISVAGSGFVNTKDLLKCRFGSAVVSANFINDALIMCQAPVSSRSLSRVSALRLRSATRRPLVSSPYAGARFVAMQTTNSSTTLPTAPAPSTPAPDSGTIVGNNSYVGVPPPKNYVDPGALAQPVYKVGFTANGQDFTEANTKDGDFQYYSDPTVSAVSPSWGETAGGLLVTVFGTDFRPTDSLACKFGSEPTSLPVVADYVSSIEARCNSSVHVIGEVVVMVSLNRQQYHFNNSLRFEYRQCPPGKFSRVHKDPCKECAPGSYANRGGLNVCKICPRDQYQRERGQTACLQCPKNTWMLTNVIRDHPSKCTCKPGYYHPTAETGVECIPCPTGADCEGGTAPPRAQPGYWESDLAPQTFLLCDVPDACAGGDPQSCSSGYGGRLCGRCLDGYYQTGKHCEVCPDLAIWILVFFIIFCCLVAALLLKSVGKHATSYGATVGIGTYFFQVLSMLNKLEMNWPPLIRKLISFITAPFTFDIDILATECSFPVSFRSKWVVTMVLPFAFCLLFVFIYWFNKLDYELKKMSIRRTAKARRKREARLGTAMEQYGLIRHQEITDDDDLPAEEWEEKKMSELTNLPGLRRRLTNAFLLLLSLFYLLIVMAALEIFDCTTREDGLSTLDVHPALVCTDSWWYAFLPIGILGVVGYGAILPTCLYWWLVRNQHRMYTPEFLEGFGSLYSDYKIEYCWWEPVNMLQKFMMVLPLLYLTSFPDFQVVMFLVVLFIGLTISFSSHPFYIERYNRLQTNLRWCACLLLMVGMVYRIGKFPHWSVEWVLLSLGLVVILASILTLLVVVLGDMVVTKVALLRNVAKRDMESLHVLMHPHGKTEIIQWLGAQRSGSNFQAKLCYMLHDIGEQFVVAYNDKLDTTVHDFAPFDRFVNLYTGGVFFTPAVPFLRQWLLMRISAVQADPVGSQRELQDVLNFTSTFAEFNNFVRLKTIGELGAGGEVGDKGSLDLLYGGDPIGDIDAIAEEACTSIIHTMFAGMLKPESTGKVLQLILKGDTHCLRYISAALLGLPEMMDTRLYDSAFYTDRGDSHIDVDKLSEEQPLIPFLHMLYEDTFTDFAMYELGNLIEDTELPDAHHDFRRDKRSPMYLIHETFISTRELGGIYDGFEYDDFGYAYYTPKKSVPHRFLGGAMGYISGVFGGGKNRDMYDPNTEEVERKGWASYLTKPTDALFGTTFNVRTRQRRVPSRMAVTIDDADIENMSIESDDEERRQRHGVVRVTRDRYFLTDEEARERVRELEDVGGGFPIQH